MYGEISARIEQCPSGRSQIFTHAVRHLLALDARTSMTIAWAQECALPCLSVICPVDRYSVSIASNLGGAHVLWRSCGAWPDIAASAQLEDSAISAAAIQDLRLARSEILRTGEWSIKTRNTHGTELSNAPPFIGPPPNIVAQSTCSQTASASKIRFVIASGCDISARWLASISIVFAPIRLAMKRSRSGLIVRSWVDTA